MDKGTVLGVDLASGPDQTVARIVIMGRSEIWDRRPDLFCILCGGKAVWVSGGLMICCTCGGCWTFLTDPGPSLLVNRERYEILCYLKDASCPS